MRLLLDTPIAIWAALDPGALSEAERRAMAGSDAPLVLSAVSVWELGLKWNSFHVSGGRKGPVEPASVVAFAAAMDWELLPLTARHAATVLAEPLGHKDPFDELLLVQAQEEALRLVTRDANLGGRRFVAGVGRLDTSRGDSMVELEVRTFGNSLGVALPKEVIGRLNTGDCAPLYLIEAPDGGDRLVPYDPGFEARMAKAEDIMSRYRNTAPGLSRERQRH